MKTVFLFLALAAGTTSPPITADDDDAGFGQIRQWVREGRILPLQDILERYPPGPGGRLLDLEVEQDGGRVVYELEILHADGRVVELKVDARDGRLIKREIED